MQRKYFLLTLLVGLFAGCAECPPGGIPCVRIMVVDASTTQALGGAIVEIIDSSGASFVAHDCGTGAGCYTRLGVACAGSYSLRVTLDGYQPFQSTFSAPVGREYECAARSYQVDASLTRAPSR